MLKALAFGLTLLTALPALAQNATTLSVTYLSAIGRVVDTKDGYGCKVIKLLDFNGGVHVLATLSDADYVAAIEAMDHNKATTAVWKFAESGVENPYSIRCQTAFGPGDGSAQPFTDYNIIVSLRVSGS